MTSKYLKIMFASYVFGIALMILQKQHFLNLENTFSSVGIVILTVTIFLGGILAWHKQQARAMVVLLSLFIFLVGVVVTSINLNEANSIKGFYNKKITVQGSVDVESLKLIPKSGVSFKLKANTISKNNKNVTGDFGAIRIFIKDKSILEGSLVNQYKGNIQIRGILKGINSFANPGSIDVQLYNSVNHINGRMTVEKNQLKLLGEISSLDTFRVFIKSKKESLLKKLPEKEGSLLASMTLGKYRTSDTETKKLFRDGGIAHLLAISGTHISIIVMVLMVFIKKLAFKTQVISLVIFLGIYLIVCGTPISAIRAVVMCLVFFVGRSEKLKVDSLRIIMLVAWLMLLINPLWLVDIGFQLSFVSVFGLIVLYDKVLAFMPENWPTIIRELLGISLCSQLATLPFIIYYFNRLPIFSVLINLLVVPILEIAVICFLVGFMIYLIVPFLANIFLMPAIFLATLVIKFLEVIGSGNYLAFNTGHLSLVLLVTYYVFIAIYFDVEPFVIFSQRKRNILFTMFLCFTIGILGYVRFVEFPLTVYFMDVGQGDAAVIITPKGKNIVIDTGGLDGDYDIGEMVVTPYLQYLGINTIDVLMLSHGDHDHAGGAAAVARNFKIKNLLIPADGKTATDVVMTLKSLTLATKVHAISKRATFNLADCKINILAGGTAPSGKPNDTSLVTEIVSAGKNLIFTGDASENEEIEAINFWTSKKCDLLKVSHHGSNSSTCKEFLDVLKPKLAVVSVGKNNLYGHPNKDVLQRLHVRNMQVLRTDLLGSVKILWKNDKHIWQSYRYQSSWF